MFGWWKKSDAEQLALARQHDASAGAAIGKEMSDALEMILRERFQPIHDGYLNILRDGIHDAFKNPPMPPILLARAAYEIFAKNLGELKAEMADEIAIRMGEWLKIADQIGVRADVEAGISQRIEDFIFGLQTGGVHLMSQDYGPALIATDEAWRRDNPDAAARFPKD